MSQQWTHKVRPPGLPRELLDVREAAQDLAKQAEHHATPRTGIAFKTVSDVLIIGTASIGILLGLMQLWHKLNHAHPPTPHAEPPPDHHQAADTHRPQPRRHAHAAEQHGHKSHQRA